MEYGLKIRGQALKSAFPPNIIIERSVSGECSLASVENTGGERRTWPRMGLINKHTSRTCDRQSLLWGRLTRPTPLSISFGTTPQGYLLICSQPQLLTQGDVSTVVFPVAKLVWLLSHRSGPCTWRRMWKRGNRRAQTGRHLRSQPPQGRALEDERIVLPTTVPPSRQGTAAPSPFPSKHQGCFQVSD